MPVPVEDFFRPAQIRSVQLSPNGRQVAVAVATPSAESGGRVSLWVFDLERMDKPTPLIRYKDADVTSVQWLNDTRLLFGLADLQASVGDRTIGGGLFSIASDGTGLRTLVQSSFDRPPEGAQARRPLSGNHVLLHVPRADEGRTLIVGRMVSDRQRGLREVLPQRLDIETGRATSLALGAPDNVQSWIFDAAGEPRVAVAEVADRRLVWWRAPGTSEWRKIQDVESLSSAWVPSSPVPRARWPSAPSRDACPDCVWIRAIPHGAGDSCSGGWSGCRLPGNRPAEPHEALPATREAHRAPRQTRPYRGGLGVGHV
jgi:hypothetical protein